MKKIFKNTLFLLLLFVVVNLYSSSTLSSFRGLVLSNTKIPIYENNRLQTMIFCDKARRQGVLIVAEHAVMDMIKPNSNADSIIDGWQTKFYSLESLFPPIVSFWKSRDYSEGMLLSNKVEIDQESQIAVGNKEVFFRSPMVDLDGVGFEANFNKRVIKINSMVNVVLRSNEFKPSLYFNKGINKDYQAVTASSDSMIIDLEKNQITMIDNVIVNDVNTTLNCQNMLITFSNTNLNKSKNKNSIGDISEIFCTGNVIMARSSGKEKQRGFSDELHYNVAKGVVTLTGKNKGAKVINGEEEIVGKKIVFNRLNQTMNAIGDCEALVSNAQNQDKGPLKVNSDKMNFYSQKNYGEFLGNVKVEDEEMKILCGKMEILLENVTDLIKEDKVEESNNSPVSSMAELNFSGGKREVKQINCFENVHITNKLSEESKKRGEKKPTEIFAQKSNLKIAENKLIFNDKVRFIDNDFKLNCNNMEIFVKDTSTGKVEKLTAKPSNVTLQENKELEKIVCNGNVHVVDSSSNMKTDKLTMTFRKLKKNEKITPNMLVSNGMVLDKVYGDGNLIVESIAKNSKKSKSSQTNELLKNSSSKRILKADRGIIDSLNNLSTFLGNVSVDDDKSLLICQEMYIYTQNVDKQKKVEKKATVVDPDADPFAVSNVELVPPTIFLTPDIELSRILCKKDVEISTVDKEGNKQKAVGEQADYLVSTEKIVMTSVGDKKVYIENKDGKMSGEKIIVYLKDERMEIIGNTDLQRK